MDPSIGCLNRLQIIIYIQSSASEYQGTNGKKLMTSYYNWVESYVHVDQRLAKKVGATAGT